jgi:hypothetical protein
MLLMPLATLLAFDLQVLMWCPKSLPLVNTASSAKVGFSQGNTWGVTGSLGPHRAHAEHRVCGPGLPRQRAPQAWGTLRQRGGSEPLARTTRSASFQPGHTTGAVLDPVPNPDYYHQVLGGVKAGAVARGLPAGLPAGWHG